MATCEDLVNAVNALDTTLQSILGEVQELRAVHIETKEEITKVEKHLGYRLPARAFWVHALTQIVSAVNLTGDVIAERIAQDTQANFSNSIPATDVPEITLPDGALDSDTPGTI